MNRQEQDNLFLNYIYYLVELHNAFKLFGIFTVYGQNDYL